MVDVTDEFVAVVMKCILQDGFEHVDFIVLQSEPDGNFSTVTTPNPEDKNALPLGIEQAKETDADIVLGIDPDCDRAGVAVKTSVEYEILTGNQIGDLLNGLCVKTH